MAYLTKDELLQASDLEERDVQLPSLGNGAKVRVRSLSAEYSNQAQSEALEMKQIGNDQVSTVNIAKLEVIQVLHGVIEPKMTTFEEARKFAERCGPSFKAVVGAIDEISGVDKEAIEKAEARFPRSGESASGGRLGAADSRGQGDSGPGVPARAGARSGKDG